MCPRLMLQGQTGPRTSDPQTSQQVQQTGRSLDPAESSQETVTRLDNLKNLNPGSDGRLCVQNPVRTCGPHAPIGPAFPGSSASTGVLLTWALSAADVHLDSSEMGVSAARSQRQVCDSRPSHQNTCFLSADVTSCVSLSVQSASTAAGRQEDTGWTEQEAVHDPPAQFSQQVQTPGRPEPRPGPPFRPRRQNREERGHSSLQGRCSDLSWVQIWDECLQSESSFSVLC